ncbi:MAG: hypothetical protein KBD52_02650 [Candidatus Pacebacteria bacterium]|nr:hypothetical protein [Candidatus Paceibacterota bacterium]
MQNKKLIRFVESFVLMPIMTVGLPLGGLSDATLNLATNRVDAPQTVLSQKLNIGAFNSIAKNEAVDLEAEKRQLRAEAIDAYYKKYNMPLEGYGMKMVLEAEKNGLDYRLIPAISVIESTGGKFACKKVTSSFLGWGSCRINFESHDKAIEIVAWNLGGNNPKTDHYYANKTVKGILETYNPPSIVPNYAAKVMKVMEDIGPADLGEIIKLDA